MPVTPILWRKTGWYIPNSVTDCCFARQAREGNLVIPDTVTSVSEGTFAGYRKLTSVVIPRSITRLDDLKHILECSSLKRIELASDNDSFILIDGVYNRQCDRLLWCARCRMDTLILPASLTSMAGDSLSEWDLTYIEVEPGNQCFESKMGLLYSKSGIAVLSQTDFIMNFLIYHWRRESYSAWRKGYQWVSNMVEKHKEIWREPSIWVMEELRNSVAMQFVHWKCEAAGGASQPIWYRWGLLSVYWRHPWTPITRKWSSLLRQQFQTNRCGPSKQRVTHRLMVCCMIRRCKRWYAVPKREPENWWCLTRCAP